MMKQSLITLTDGKEEISSLEDFEADFYCSSCGSVSRVHHSLARNIKERINSKDIFFSFEFLPPRTPFGIRNLLQRLHSIQDGGPLFCSVTWHTGNNPGSTKETSTISFAGTMAKSYNFDSMLHLAAVNLKRDQVITYLQTAYNDGIRTVLALRGDVNPGWICPEDGFPHAIDLVHFIREHFGDIFTVGVAGYPSGHHEANSYEEDLIHLKKKVDAGADFVISQIFFSADIFKKFVWDCKRHGINVPVIPGILPILSFSSLWRIAGLCHLEIPPEILKPLMSVAHNEQAATNFGIHFAFHLAKELLISNTVPALHFFTLNREQVTIEVCKQLGIWQREPAVLPSMIKTCISIEQLKDYLQLHRKKGKYESLTLVLK